MSLQALQAGGNVGKTSELLLQAASSLEDFKVSFQAQLNDLLPITPAVPGYNLTNFQTSLLGNFGNLQSRGQKQSLLCSLHTCKLSCGYPAVHGGQKVTSIISLIMRSSAWTPMENRIQFFCFSAQLSFWLLSDAPQAPVIAQQFGQWYT